MFKQALTAKFKHKIECSVATESGPKQITFSGVFLRAEQSEIDRMFAAKMSDDEIVRSKLVGWCDVPENPEFNEENLAAALAIDGMRAVIARAFFEGNSAATVKN
jgi:hypothetical protein